MTRYLRFEVAAHSQTYRDVRDQAVVELTAHGFFAKDDVLAKTGNAWLVRSIEFRWDYLGRMINEVVGRELIPLGQSFFTRQGRLDAQFVPERCLAQGHGKKTVGYALISEKNKKLVLKRHQQKVNQALGKVAAANRLGDHTRQALGTVGVGTLEAHYVLPAPERAALLARSEC